MPDDVFREMRHVSPEVAVGDEVVSGCTAVMVGMRKEMLVDVSGCFELRDVLVVVL